MVHYYSKLLGMKDTISEQDLIFDSDIKTKLEKELESERNKRDMLEEQVAALQSAVEEKNKMDSFMLRFIKGLIKNGKIDDMLQYVKDENLENDSNRVYLYDFFGLHIDGRKNRSLQALGRLDQRRQRRRHEYGVHVHLQCEKKRLVGKHPIPHLGAIFQASLRG